jgi:hypothetical protein
VTSASAIERSSSPTSLALGAPHQALNIQVTSRANRTAVTAVRRTSFQGSTSGSRSTMRSLVTSVGSDITR